MFIHIILHVTAAISTDGNLGDLCLLRFLIITDNTKTMKTVPLFLKHIKVKKTIISQNALVLITGDKQIYPLPRRSLTLNVSWQ